MDQSKLASINKTAWESDSYAAWVQLYGTPLQAAEIIQAGPAKKLRRVLEYLPELKGLNVANL